MNIIHISCLITQRYFVLICNYCFFFKLNHHVLCNLFRDMFLMLFEIYLYVLYRVQLFYYTLKSTLVDESFNAFSISYKLLSHSHQIVISVIKFQLKMYENPYFKCVLGVAMDDVILLLLLTCMGQYVIIEQDMYNKLI